MPIRPELAARSAAAFAEGKEAASRGDVIAAAAAYTRAAAVFAGTTDADELDERHRALADAGGVLRKAGHLAEAEVAYEAMSAATHAELGAASRPFLLSRYFVGLIRSDREDYLGSALLLEQAYTGFSALPDEAHGTRLMGAALGLAWLRARYWDEAVNVLRRLAGSPIEDESGASILHNLAVALVRGGNASMALTFARSAVALRARLNGPNHPSYIETRLVEALALVDSGQLAEAAPILREAAQTVLAGVGEAHAFFADALLIEGRRLARLGDGAAGEALARRALFVAGRAGMPAGALEDRRLDAAAIGPIWRTGPKAEGPRDVRLWRVELQHTLRRYQVQTIDFIGSGDAAKVWYYFVPSGVSPAHPERALRLVRLALADASALLNSREPADANFLDVTSFVAREPTIPELLATPMDAVFKARTWENSVAYSVVAGDRSQSLAPFDFALALNAYVTLRGGRADLASWVKLGIDAGALERARASPEAVLQETLWAAA